MLLADGVLCGRWFRRSGRTLRCREGLREESKQGHAQEERTAHRAITLSGIGYFCDVPIIFPRGTYVNACGRAIALGCWRHGLRGRAVRRWIDVSRCPGRRRGLYER